MYRQVIFSKQIGQKVLEMRLKRSESGTKFDHRPCQLATATCNLANCKNKFRGNMTCSSD